MPAIALGARFIPARAGNTSRPRAGRSRKAVYPRSRGEHIWRFLGMCQRAGLSPLARGTPEAFRLLVRLFRFIPARAGNTVPTHAGDANETVYPRSRGEHDHRAGMVRLVNGLSPLARGTRLLLHLGVKQLRFIPARAGNTKTKTRTTRPATVYPRSRGEHEARFYTSGGDGGLSPLARGTLKLLLPVHDPGRFIPARAGNTRIVHYCNGRMPVYPRSRGEHSKAIQLFYKGIFHTQQSTNLFITSPHS